MKNRIAAYCTIMGITLILFPCMIVLSTSILFLLGMPVSSLSFWISAGISMVGALFLIRTYFPTGIKVVVLAFLAGMVMVFGVSLWVSAKTYDLSWDGQTYQQAAIILLKDGWNPVLDQPIQPMQVGVGAQLTGKEMLNAFHLWINHYAKGPWLLDAVFYKLTGKIEWSKMFNFLLLFASFFLCLAANLLATPKKVWRALLFSALLACNPVVFTQLTSFYIDGQLASLVVIFCALGYILIKQFDRWIMLALCGAIVLMVNVKFTALVYAVLLSGGLLLLYFLYEKNGLWKKMIIPLGAAFLIGVGVVGYNPYITNTVTKGHPFYPLAGKDAVDIMFYNSPKDFPEMNRWEKLFITTFAKSENIGVEHSSQLKLPFTGSAEEVKIFISPDVRVGGFGPLFGAASLLGCFVLIGIVLYQKSRSVPLLVVIGLLFATVVVNPECWWARYVPQLWMIPLLLALAGMESKKRFLQFGSWLLVAVLAVNLFLVGAGHIAGQRYANRLLEQQLAEIKESRKTILVDFHYFVANRIRLQEAGIHFTETKMEDKNAKQLASSRTTYLFK